MIGTGCRGAHEFNCLAGEQRFIDFRDRANHQRIGAGQRVDRDGTAGDRLDFAQATKKLAGIGHIFINEDFHGSVPV